jgi:hypothetical protein
MPYDDNLDHTPLTFGKYKGKTPDEVSQMGTSGENYIVWMYDNVDRFPTCSEALARACGWKPPQDRPLYKPPMFPKPVEFDGIDDDDIPF